MEDRINQVDKRGHSCLSRPWQTARKKEGKNNTAACALRVPHPQASRSLQGPRINQFPKDVCRIVSPDKASGSSISIFHIHNWCCRLFILSRYPEEPQEIWGEAAAFPTSGFLLGVEVEA